MAVQHVMDRPHHPRGGGRLARQPVFKACGQQITIRNGHGRAL
jgi:hypothetical protein